MLNVCAKAMAFIYVLAFELLNLYLKYCNVKHNAFMPPIIDLLCIVFCITDMWDKRCLFYSLDPVIPNIQNIISA